MRHLLLLPAFAVLIAIAQPAHADDDAAKSAIGALLEQMTAALKAADGAALWELIDTTSQERVAAELAALKALVTAMPAGMRNARPPGWAEVDSFAAIVDATPQQMLSIWLRSSTGRSVADDLAAAGRVRSVTLSPDGTNALFALDGEAINPPRLAVRETAGWRLRLLQ